jgi:hypothetical protein
MADIKAEIEELLMNVPKADVRRCRFETWKDYHLLDTDTKFVQLVDVELFVNKIKELCKADRQRLEVKKKLFVDTFEKAVELKKQLAEANREIEELKSFSRDFWKAEAIKMKGEIERLKSELLDYQEGQIKAIVDRHIKANSLTAEDVEKIVDVVRKKFGTRIMTAKYDEIIRETIIEALAGRKEET